MEERLLHESVRSVNQALVSKVTLDVVPLSGRRDDSATQDHTASSGGPGPHGWIFSVRSDSFLVWQAVRERAPAPLSLFQSVQDELAGVDKSLYTVNEAHFCPGVQLRPRLIHAFLLGAESDGVSKGVTNDAEEKAHIMPL